jgi:protein TonB
MFEESLVESTTILRNRNRWPAVISLTAQAMLALALVSLPMLHPEVLSLRTPSLITFTPPRPTPPPPPAHVHLTPTVATASAATAPTSLFNEPRRTPTTSSTPTETPNFNPTSISTMPGGSNSSPFGASVPGTGSVVHAGTISTSTTSPGKRLNVSTGVSAGLLINPIQPVYPPIARAAHVGGTVIVQAVISKTGHIEATHVLSGPAMLQQAALDAVRNARYHPYLLNGEPTEVDTTFSINFNLGGS